MGCLSFRGSQPSSCSTCCRPRTCSGRTTRYGSRSPAPTRTTSRPFRSTPLQTCGSTAARALHHTSTCQHSCARRPRRLRPEGTSRVAPLARVAARWSERLVGRAQTHVTDDDRERRSRGGSLLLLRRPAVSESRFEARLAVALVGKGHAPRAVLLLREA